MPYYFYGSLPIKCIFYEACPYGERGGVRRNPFAMNRNAGKGGVDLKHDNTV